MKTEVKAEAKAKVGWWEAGRLSVEHIPSCGRVKSLRCGGLVEVDPQKYDLTRTCPVR